MKKKILEVTAVSLELEKKNPPTLLISASGNVNTGGWSNAILVPYIYKKLPADGLYDFDLVADAPDGVVSEVISPISAEPLGIPDPKGLVKGVMIHASLNMIKAFIKTEYDAEKRLLNNNSLPFDIVGEEEIKNLKNDHYGITNAFLWEDTLHISVTYGGGCKEHLFRLVWDGNLSKSNPPQITLHLLHDAQDDHCRALLQQELQFDLSAHLEQETIIHLTNWDQDLKFR